MGDPPPAPLWHGFLPALYQRDARQMQDAAAHPAPCTATVDASTFPSLRYVTPTNGRAEKPLTISISEKPHGPVPGPSIGSRSPSD
jgi:hypothetical protein